MATADMDPRCGRRRTPKERAAPALVRRVGAVLVAALFLPLAAFAAENPFLGRWAVQIVGQTQDVIFQFTDDGELLVLAEGQETEAQPYTLDSAEGLIEFSTPETGSMVCRYSLEGEDTFLMYLTGSLLDQISQASAGGMPAGANEVTVVLFEELQKAMRSVFAENPFIKGTRLD